MNYGLISRRSRQRRPRQMNKSSALDLASYTTPHKVVSDTDNAQLLRFGDPSLPPLLIVYSLVNRPVILDLSPKRSVMTTLRTHEVCPYLLAWRPPQAARRHLGLADYILGDIAEAVNWITRAHQQAPALLGVCQGGVLALCHAAVQPASVAGVITLATPWNNSGNDNRLAQIAKRIDISALIAATGNVRGPWLAMFFAALKPFALGPQRYSALTALAQASSQEITEFMRMERWMYDGPDLAGTAFAEFAEQIYQKNALANATLHIDSEPVSLQAIQAPVLNAYALDDHLVPPSAAQDLAQAVSGPATEMSLPGGHLSLFIGRRAHAELYPKIANWVLQRSNENTCQLRNTPVI